MLNAADKKRLTEILRLKDDADSRDVWKSIEWARRMKLREEDPQHRRAISRRRLEKIRKSAHALAEALSAVPEKANETVHLYAALAPTVVDWKAMTTSTPSWSLEDEIERAQRLERACSDALRAFPKVGHEPKQDLRGPILLLAHHFQRRTGRRASSSPGGEFAELVAIVMNLDTKRIQEALRRAA